MPQDQVPFSAVREFLERNGYEYLRRRTDPTQPNRGVAIFSSPGRPQIGFPVVDKHVAYEHFKRIKAILQEWPEEGGAPESEGEDY